MRYKVLAGAVPSGAVQDFSNNPEPAQCFLLLRNSVAEVATIDAAILTIYPPFILSK